MQNPKKASIFLRLRGLALLEIEGLTAVDLKKITESIEEIGYGVRLYFKGRLPDVPEEKIKEVIAKEYGLGAIPIPFKSSHATETRTAYVTLHPHGNADIEIEQLTAEDLRKLSKAFEDRGYGVGIGLRHRLSEPEEKVIDRLELEYRLRWREGKGFEILD